MKTCFKLLFCFVLTSFLLIGCGTLGGFDERTLPVSRAVLEIAFDSLYQKYPNLNIPDKWKRFDDWAERGYGFLESRIFYFRSVPEEMYYVTFVGDSATLANSSTATIAIRAVDNGIGRWKKVDDFEKDEISRIQNRFDTGVISKLKTIISQSQ